MASAFGKRPCMPRIRADCALPGSELFWSLVVAPFNFAANGSDTSAMATQASSTSHFVRLPVTTRVTALAIESMKPSRRGSVWLVCGTITKQ